VREGSPSADGALSFNRGSLLPVSELRRSSLTPLQMAREIGAAGLRSRERPLVISESRGGVAR
jgi:hypothetical protein